MPTYDYQCEKCGYRFERVQSIRAAPLRRCPTCQGRVRRLLSHTVNFIFKGPGFYATDYRKGKPPKEEKGGEEKKSQATTKED